MPTVARSAPSRRRRAPRLYPEELLALVLFVVTLALNVAVHHSLNARIVTETARTYLTLFRAQFEFFSKTLAGCALASGAWQLLRFVAGHPVHLVAWRHTGKLGPILRALLIYALCCVAFENLQGFIHILSPIDRDDWLIAADRALFLGNDPLKLLDPLVSYYPLEFFIQVYISYFFVPFVVLLVFLQGGKLRAFRETIVSLVLALVIGYPGYLLLPAIGPQYTLQYEFSHPGLNTDDVLINGLDSLPRDSFPSLHTAVSVVALILIWRHSSSRLYRGVTTIWLLAIVFSTVYLRIHYVADAVAGIALALLATHLGPRVNARYGGDLVQTQA
jgi:membrane-associated phospholipid phosphatase